MQKSREAVRDQYESFMKYFGTDEAIEIDGLMREFRPHTFNKLPTTVAILDTEMSHLAKLADSRPESEADR